ncbi:MAG TPA: NUDIX domain-containing protein [Sphingomonas sp.]|nr:NUDIX domain-containing protein [Sphingomonas sp.]
MSRTGDGFSAGVLLYRRADGALSVLLVHPGGPYWRNRWAGAWQIPKGQAMPGETALAAARREFEEELGTAPVGEAVPLGRLRQRGGKLVEAFAIEGEFDIATLTSIAFELEWPPKSGAFRSFPEVDAARWFALDEARTQILPSQQPFLDRLVDTLGN